MSENLKKVKIVENNDVYQNDTNGWTENGYRPEEQKQIKYIVDESEATQNYLKYDDLAIVVPVRKNPVTGEFEFGLIEQDAPALVHVEDNNMTPDSYRGVMLEAISTTIPKEDIDIEKISQLLSDTYSFEALGIKDLDTSRTSILESFSNQCANFYTMGVMGDGSNKMHWTPISSLRDFLETQRMGKNGNVHTSISTLYALELLYEKYKKDISKHTKFEIDRPLPELKILKTIEKVKGYRFSIKERYYINTSDYTKDELAEITKLLGNIPEENVQLHGDNERGELYITLPKENGESLRVNVQVASYAQSNMKKQQSNAGNTMLVTENGKRFLSPQIRSPFIEENTEIRLGGSGGMLEPGETDIKARALRELLEEQGTDATNATELTALLPAIPNCTEMSQCFVAKYDSKLDIGELSLDAVGEHIGEKIAFSHEDIAKKSGIALTSKYYDQVLHRHEQEQIEKNLKQLTSNKDDIEK